MPDIGEDRWMPDRMRAVGFLIQGEKRVYEDYLRLLDGWFGAIRTNVVQKTARIIDPLGVFTGGARLAKLISDFASGGVSWVLRRAYQRVAGESFPFSSRPFVAQHLAQVANRMVRLPDEVFNLITRAVDEGTNAGDSIPDIAARIDAELLRTGSEHWTNRARTVARTETVGAYNGGTQDAFEVMSAEFDEPLEKIWLATMDPRTRDSHFVADGQRVPLAAPFIVGGFPGMYPGDPALPASQVINCRCTHLVVEPGEDVDMAGRGWKAASVTAQEVKRRSDRGIIRARDV